MYHFNPETGKTGNCNATKRECPYMHGDTPEEARAAHEETMTQVSIPRVKRVLTKGELQTLPSKVLSRIPLKELDAAQLAQTLRHEASRLGMGPKAIDSAIDLASILHAHQTRANRGLFKTTPYIEHPLRNSLRLIRLGCKDQDVVIAAILHDTIEDGAKVFVEKFHNNKTDEPTARIALGKHIGAAYGERVLSLVESVTNDYVTDSDKSKLTISEKNSTYLKHVAQNIKGNSGVYLVKVSDFIDNATGLYHNNTPARAEKTKKQAAKYLPVVNVFLDELDKLEIDLPPEGIKTIRDQLGRTTERLQKIINNGATNE